MLKFIVATLMGGLAAVLAQTGIAVFNDGLRPLMPEFIEGRMKRNEILTTAFALSFGLVIGFGIPFSLTANILLIHSIFLMTDIIGVGSPNRYIAGLLGGLWGLGTVFGLEFVVKAFELLPVNFLDALGKVGGPIVVAFAAFPALAVALQHGWLKGAITLLLSAVARQTAIKVNPIAIGGANVNINPEGAALIVGMALLLIFAGQVKAESGSGVDLASIFSDRVARIKKNWLILAIMGALVAAAANLGLAAGDPISLNLVAEGQITDAGIAALARALGFIPLVATTAIATGVYGPVGMTFVFALGLLLPNVVFAAIAGGAVIALEVLLLDYIARFFDKFPGMRAAGEHIRTSMTKLMEIALLVGGMIAGEAMAPGLGFLVVAGAVVLNEVAGHPINRLAIGPVAAILMGILVNLLNLVGLFTPPA